jgi:hypothetical protein
VGLVTTGIGGALLAAGVGFSLDAKRLDARSREDDHCDASGCDASGLVLNHQALHAANTATALAVAGGTLLASGLTLTLVARAHASTRAGATTPAFSAWIGKDVGLRAIW